MLCVGRQRPRPGSRADLFTDSGRGLPLGASHSAWLAHCRCAQRLRCMCPLLQRQGRCSMCHVPLARHHISVNLNSLNKAPTNTLSVKLTTSALCFSFDAHMIDAKWLAMSVPSPATATYGCHAVFPPRQYVKCSSYSGSLLRSTACHDARRLPVLARLPAIGCITQCPC